jgi:hypothetical protein
VCISTVLVSERVEQHSDRANTGLKSTLHAAAAASCKVLACCCSLCWLGMACICCQLTSCLCCRSPKTGGSLSCPHQPTAWTHQSCRQAAVKSLVVGSLHDGMRSNLGLRVLLCPTCMLLPLVCSPMPTAVALLFSTAPFTAKKQQGLCSCCCCTDGLQHSPAGAASRTCSSGWCLLLSHRRCKHQQTLQCLLLLSPEAPAHAQRTKTGLQ